MYTRIPWHPVPVRPFDASFGLSLLPGVVARARASMPSVGPSAGVLADQAAHALAAGDVVVGRRLLQAAADVTSIVWLGSERRGTLSFSFDGAVHEGEAGPMHWSSTPVLWLHGVTLSLALRRVDALTPALRYPVELCRRAGSSRRDEWVPLFADAIQATLTGATDADARRREAAAWMHPSRVVVASPLYAHHAHGLLTMLDATARMDQAAFTNGALGALHAHRRRVMRGDLRASVTGLFDFELAGVAALGVDSGLAWELDTPYVPSWVVNGGAS